jgi:hypothetical protein
MKSILIFMCCLLMTGCKIPESELSKLLSGNHILRRFKVVTTTGAHFSAGYFLLMGSASGGTESETKVLFSWQAPNGDFYRSEISVVDVRVHTTNVSVPFVRFHWRITAEGLEYYVTHPDLALETVTVYCREEDYPCDIKLDNL